MIINQEEDKPGEIHYRGRAKQLVNFSGLAYTSPANGSTITPTDVDGGVFVLPIDGLIEYNSEGYIFFDLKLNGADFHYGQRLCFKRLIDDISKPAVFFVADHDVADPQKDVYACSAIVRQLYYNSFCGGPSPSKWVGDTPAQTTLKNYIDRFISKYFTLPERPS